MCGTWILLGRGSGLQQDITVSRYTYIRSVMSITSKMGWSIHYMDVKTIFINGVIQEEVYIEKPQGFEEHGRDSHVFWLNKALYELKQAPRAWYSKVSTYLQELGFQKSDVDPNIYFIVVGEDPLILVLHVDDLFITSVERLIVGCNRDLFSKYEMKDIGLMHCFLGLKVWQELGHIFLGQEKCAVDILRWFQMQDCRPMTMPTINNQKNLSYFESLLVDSTLYH